MAEYGRSITDLDEESANKCVAPKSSGASFWRRWWAGLQVAIYAPLCLQFVIWVLDAISIRDWSSSVLKACVSIIAIIVVLVGIPVLTYEMAYLFIVRPWFKQHMRKSLLTNHQSLQDRDAETA